MAKLSLTVIYVHTQHLFHSKLEKKMASQDPSIISLGDPLFDEQRWVKHIRRSLDDDEEEEEVRIPVSVFAVPKPLRNARPEAFAPQLFAVGPYHHWSPNVYEMERYKLATAKRTQKKLQGLKLHNLVDHFAQHDHIIRSHYHRYLDYTGETLGWLMAIDASFLLEFLNNYTDMDGKVYGKIPSMSHMVDAARIKLSYNLILRDAVMLENQIPLFVLREILRFQSPSQQIADEQLSKMLRGFVMDVSPFIKSAKTLPTIDVTQHAHVLQVLYCTIVPKAKLAPETYEIEVDESMDMPESKEEEEKGTGAESGYVKQLFDSVKGMNLGPVVFVKKILFSQPLKFMVKVPWNIISNFPVISAFKGPLASLFEGKGGGKSKDDDDDDKNKHDKPPLVEEIMIPSVSELTRAGVKFSATDGDLMSIAFDVKMRTFYLPTVSLDANTEVLLRNLVAYETSVESGPMVFTRYTELINGIIDTDEDVKLLRQRGIILNRMKSDEEVAKLWNGMSKSVRLSKVGFIDQVLVDVNQYYNSRWSVKSRQFMKTYVLGSWQILTLLAALMLLFLTSVQAFCSVYRCNAHFTKFTNSES